MPEHAYLRPKKRTCQGLRLSSLALSALIRQLARLKPLSPPLSACFIHQVGDVIRLRRTGDSGAVTNFLTGSEDENSLGKMSFLPMYRQVLR